MRLLITDSRLLQILWIFGEVAASSYRAVGASCSAVGASGKIQSDVCMCSSAGTEVGEGDKNKNKVVDGGGEGS